MSTVLDSIMELTRYTESSPITCTFHRADERSSGRPKRADSSFLDTIVGRREPAPNSQPGGGRGGHEHNES
jgi:hypothetical protein